MAETGVEGKPRNIYFSYKGVDVDIANSEIRIEGRWYHTSQIKTWQGRNTQDLLLRVGADVYLDDTELPIFRWRTLRDATRRKMIEALRIIRP